MKMFNGNILCEDISEKVKESNSGFETRNEEKFKNVTVVESSETDVPKGSVIKVSVHAGQEIVEEGKNFLVIKRTDIIYVL